MAPPPFNGRREDLRLISGQGRYTADVNLPGQYYAAFLRADRAHALIRAIDTAAARAAPGVVAVYTAADTEPGAFKAPGTLVGYPGRGGSRVLVPSWLPLARERVRYVGEEVALVVADSSLAAQDAAGLITVDYDDLPAVAHPEDAIKPGAPQVHDSNPGNQVFDYEYGNEAATAAAFAAAPHTVRLKLDSQRVAPCPMEPRACVVSYDGGAFDLHVPNQGQAMLRPGLCHMLGLEPSQVRIHAQDVGGGFGARAGPYMDMLILMWAARKLGRAIKWTGTRAEQLATEAHGRALTIEAELALDGDGRFRAFRMHWICDQGAYLTAAGPLINTMNGSLTLGGAYAVTTGYGRHRCVLTNTCPTTAYRGAGRPDMAYAVERLVDEAAVKLGMDRVAIRRLNAIPKEAMPFKNAAGIAYDSGDFAGLLDRAVEAADWAGFAARRAQSQAQGKLRGLGLALFLEPSGGGGAPKDQVALRFAPDGTLKLHAVTQSHGQGHETVFPELVGATLGIPAEQIVLDTADPMTASLIGNGVVGSRTVQQFGSAFKLGALDVIRKGTLLAARRLEAAPDDIEFVDGTYRVKGTDVSIAMADLITECRGQSPHPLDADAEVPLSRAFPSGVHVAEVEIDPDTGHSSIASYVAVDDCGTVLNHTLVEGQIHGGLAQGAGQVFGEHGIYDRETGQWLTGSFMDYTMPRAGLLPAVRAIEHGTPSPTNFLGAKGTGEAGTTGALPTLMNALVDALRPLGIAHLDMPATPARVWQAIATRST
jgi:carbon-monoxide dehydrogenase large subunit